MALRTRSKSSSTDLKSTIIFNFSELVGKVKKEIELSGRLDESNEGDFEFISNDTPMDSLPLPTIKGNPEENKKLLESLSMMEISLSTRANIDENFNKEENMEKYSALSKTMMNKAKEIELPETCIGVSEEYNKIKNITFIKDKLKYDDALSEIIKALAIMALVDLKSLPVENLENIIRLLIAVCCDCNAKIKYSYDTIAQLEFDIYELLNLNHKLEAIDIYRRTLEDELKRLINDNDKLKDDYIKVQEKLNEQMEIEKD